jgi:transcriptional regulator with XRE-family HTH domain
MKAYNNELTRLGYNIRKWRELKDIKQQELAHELHKDKSWLSQVENGRIDISYTQVNRIAGLLSIRPSLLFEDFPSMLPSMEAGSDHTSNLQNITVMVKEILSSIKDYKPGN